MSIIRLNEHALPQAEQRSADARLPVGLSMVLIVLLSAALWLGVVWIVRIIS